MIRDGDLFSKSERDKYSFASAHDFHQNTLNNMVSTSLSRKVGMYEELCGESHFLFYDV